MQPDQERKKALELAVGHIKKQFGDGRSCPLENTLLIVKLALSKPAH